MMQSFLKVWLVTTGIFLVGDLVWISLIMNRFFVHQIKHLMNVTSSGITINYPSAAAAYVLITAALSWFVVMPLAQEGLVIPFIQGAGLGFCIYGVYELTNCATLNAWPLSFLVVDMAWGTVWCGLTSAVGVAAIKYFKI